MILKRVEKDNKIKAIYASSTILASTLDKTNNDLTVIFAKGGHYKYPNVSASDYLRFETAESQGVVFSSHIKKYAYEKLEAFDTAAILTEIAKLKTGETKALLVAKQTKLVDHMKRLIAVAESNETITDLQLSNLAADVRDYMAEYTKNKPVEA